MPSYNGKRSSTPSPDAENEKTEVQILGEQADSLRKSMKEMKDCSTEVETLKQEISDLKEKRDEEMIKTDKLIATLESEISEESDKLKEAQEKTAKAEEELGFIEIKLSEIQESKVQAQRELETTHSMNQEALEKIKSIEEQEVKAKEDAEKAKATLALIQNDKFEAETALAAIKAEISTLNESKAKLEAEIAESLITQSELSKECEILVKGKLNLQLAIEEEKKKKDAEFARENEESKKILAQAEQLNGDTTRKEKWLLDKAESLKKVKEELEAIYGKPLNHIKI